VTQQPEAHKLPGQHFWLGAPHAVQRADTDVAVVVAVEVEVDEQKVLACVQVLPAQHGPLAEPQTVQVPALVL
jgi:hypothetical protein